MTNNQGLQLKAESLVSDSKLTFPVFQPFPKIPRLKRYAIISEKIDGTNAQVHVTDDGRVLAGSRTRYITPSSDNAGFAKWVEAHQEELGKGLGPGVHYGEWWGPGIQRGYGLKEKRFSLINTDRWKIVDGVPNYPSCVSVVPVLSTGVYTDEMVNEAIGWLRSNGSFAAPGFMKPEGVVVFMTAGHTMHKVLLENDELPKGVTTYMERTGNDPR